MSYRNAIESWARSALNAKITGDWGNYKSPCHDDRAASGRIDLNNGWCWCQACEVGCWPDQLAEQYSLQPPPMKDGAPGVTPEEGATEYVYKTEEGIPVHKTIKKLVDGRKKFSQAAWIDKGWDLSGGCLDRVERLLYHLPELARSTGPTIFVEGEKDVHTAERLGFAATTSPQGAGKASKVLDWSALAGREVVIIPDNDDVGERHAEEVKAILSGLAEKCEIIHLPGLPDKGDLSDWVKLGGTKEQFSALVYGALRSATPDRQFIERYYLVSAWDNADDAKVLSGYSTSRWLDRSCRECADAISTLLDNDTPIEPITIAAEMRRRGKFEAYRELNDFEASILKRRKFGSVEQARRAFADLIKWDDLTQVVTKASRRVGKGCPNKAAAELSEDVSRILSTDTTNKLKTVKQLCESYLDKVVEGTPDKKSFALPLIEELTGKLGGGDVVPICGPPKAGKSTLLMELARQAANIGIDCLVSQLELREDQVAQRELTALTGEDVLNLDEFTARRLQKNCDLSTLEHISVLTAGNTVDSHKAELWPVLAANPHIKIWFLDYNERLYEYNVDPNIMAARVAKFVKDTAVMFDVCAIPLLQPNDRYYKDGHHGPLIDHVDYGKKWRKDCQWLGFMHHPHAFDKAQPEEYVELIGLLSRSTGKAKKTLEWVPARYRFKEWTGPVWRIPDRAKEANGTTGAPLKSYHNDDDFDTLEDENFDF